MLVLHHLGVSQSERVLWLLEELGDVPYELVLHRRDPLLAPESLKSVPGNVTGMAPFLVDTTENINISESGAAVDYIIGKYGKGKLSVQPSAKNYSEYVQWLHFANGSLQANMVNCMFLGATGVDPNHPIGAVATARLDRSLSALDERLKNNTYLAGDELTAADIMTLFATSTQRYFGPQTDLTKYKNIVRWMQTCGSRPGYKRAMDKGDPDMKQLLTGEPPEASLAAVGGVDSDIWKKK